MNIPIQNHGNQHDSIVDYRSPIDIFNYNSYNNGKGGFYSNVAGLGTAILTIITAQPGYNCFKPSIRFH